MPPLVVMRDMLRHVGLLRLRQGVLRPTKAALDEIDVVRRLRSWFEPGEFDTVVAERAVALVVARGPAKVADLAVEIYPLLGRGWQRGSDPITAADTRGELGRLSHVLAGLDLIDATWSLWSSGPSARSLLPGGAGRPVPRTPDRARRVTRRDSAPTPPAPTRTRFGSRLRRASAAAGPVRLARSTSAAVSADLVR